MRNLLKVVLISITLVLSSCSDDDPVSPPETQPGPLNAKAGLNQDAEIDETVTLDGTESTGPSGFTYSWSYEGKVPEDQINFQNKTSAAPTFTPPNNGLYEFTLTISHADSSDLDETTVLVGGVIELGGTLTEDLELKNIQGNDSNPDYRITSDLIVPDGITLSITEDNVIIEFEQGTGIHVDGGTITNETIDQDESFRTEFYSMNGWKGIWVENGTINLNYSLIENAGDGIFDGLVEPAALTLSGSSTQLQSFSDNDFVNSSSYDIYVPDKFPEVFRAVLRNKLSYRIPIKAVITFMGFFHSDDSNIMPESYDYAHYIPSGANTKDVISNINGYEFRPIGAKFFIDGDFWAGASIGVSRGVTIFMKENTGILPDEGILAFGTENEMITFTGIEQSNWKGIVSRQLDSKSFQYCKFVNAGYGTQNIGGFQTKEEAVLYGAWRIGFRIENCEIIGSNGFGYYNELTMLIEEQIMRTSFKECKKGGIRVNLASVNLNIGRDHGNTFELDEGVPAVLVTEADLNPEGQLYELGEGNYYLMNTNWEIYGDFKINEGVFLKFKSGYSFTRGRSPSVTYFQIEGTSENPVIFDGEDGIPGSWGGMMLAGRFNINNLVIRNGGEFILTDATEKANLVFNYISGDLGSQMFENSTISNSAGYGIVIESGSYDFEFDDPEKNNTFTNNASGDILVKP